MKITRSWLESVSPCADGWAWGDLFVGAEGKELEDCWASIDRPDWLLWLIVKTGHMDTWAARDSLTLYLDKYLSYKEEKRSKALDVDGARQLWDRDLDPMLLKSLHAVRHAAAEAAYVYEAVAGDTKSAAECMALAFYCLAQQALMMVDDDKALTQLQAAFNMAGNAHGKERVCQFLAEAAKIKRKAA